MNQNRHPAGTPEGGRFAAGGRPGPDGSVTLADAADAEAGTLTLQARELQEAAHRVRLGEAASRLRSDHGVISFTAKASYFRGGTMDRGSFRPTVGYVTTVDDDGSMHERSDGPAWDAVHDVMAGKGGLLRPGGDLNWEPTPVTFRTGHLIEDGEDAAATLRERFNVTPDDSDGDDSGDPDGRDGLHLSWSQRVTEDDRPGRHVINVAGEAGWPALADTLLELRDFGDVTNDHLDGITVDEAEQLGEQFIGPAIDHLETFLSNRYVFAGSCTTPGAYHLLDLNRRCAESGAPFHVGSFLAAVIDRGNVDGEDVVTEAEDDIDTLSDISRPFVNGLVAKVRGR